MTTSNEGTTEEDMVFFLGSIFYPKTMKEIYKASNRRQTIKNIHSTLYQFSSTKMLFITEFAAYRLLVRHFSLNYRDNFLISNPTMVKAQEDFRNGFTYIETFNTN